MALTVPAGPLVEPELADYGDFPAFGEPFGAGGGQLVEADVSTKSAPSPTVRGKARRNWQNCGESSDGQMIPTRCVRIRRSIYRLHDT